jgi:hypothetical protein
MVRLLLVTLLQQLMLTRPLVLHQMHLMLHQQRCLHLRHLLLHQRLHPHQSQPRYLHKLHLLP